LRADQKYTTVITPHGAYLLTSSLRQIKEKFDPQAFWQIHELLPVSAAHAHLFRESRQVRLWGPDRTALPHAAALMARIGYPDILHAKSPRKNPGRADAISCPADLVAWTPAGRRAM